MQTDLEEAKAQEITKLQSSLQAVQSKVEETTAMLVKEREAARKAIEEAPPVIQEKTVVVQDIEKIDFLTAEVEQLKVFGNFICWQLEEQTCNIVRLCACVYAYFLSFPLVVYY